MTQCEIFDVSLFANNKMSDVSGCCTYVNYIINQTNYFCLIVYIYLAMMS